MRQEVRRGQKEVRNTRIPCDRAPKERNISASHSETFTFILEADQPREWVQFYLSPYLIQYLRMSCPRNRVLYCCSIFYVTLVLKIDRQSERLQFQLSTNLLLKNELPLEKGA